MSAYGVIQIPLASTAQLPSTVWKVKHKDANSEAQFVVMYHLTLASAPLDLVAFMHEEFADELERGDTYPQEPEAGTRLARDAFEAYYFVADVFLGICASHENFLRSGIDVGGAREDAGLEVRDGIALEAVRQGRAWRSCVAGFYYVKPNYPGRSSHICNGGFVVPFASRGQGFARVLARSYLHYAPQLGYEASVFNLVYVNNAASIRLWEALGFSKAGRIPRAGRLKRKDGQGEEYVDAWVFYRSFDSELEIDSRI